MVKRSVRDGGAGRRRPNSAAAHRGNPPESGNLGPPGVKTSGALAWEGQRLMRDSPGPRARHGEALSGGCCAGGGPTRQGSPVLEESGDPELSSGRDLAWERASGTRKPPEPSARHWGVRSCARNGSGGHGNRESAGVRCPAPRVTHWP